MRYHWIVLSLMGLSWVAQAEPLSFNAALALAERESPTLAAQNADIASARDSAIAAGALPDPKFFFGVDNLPVSGADSWSTTRDFMTMKKLGLMQDLPNGDKREAQRVVAAAAVDEAWGKRRVELIQLRRDTALAWVKRYYIERKMALFDSLDQQNRSLLDAVRAQMASGRSLAADWIGGNQQTLQLADRRDDLERDLAQAKAGLKRYVGAAAEQPLVGMPPDFELDPDQLHQQLAHHPDLELFSAMNRKAQAEVQEAESSKQSDWNVAVAYQKRAPEFGDMVSVQFTVDLPVFPDKRQDPLIAAKREALAELSAEKQATLRDRTAELDNGFADYTALSQQLNRMSQAELPLAQEKYDLQLSLYRAGKQALTDLIVARQEWIEQQLKAIDLQSQKSQAAVNLRFAYGEDKP